MGRQRCKLSAEYLDAGFATTAELAPTPTGLPPTVHALKNPTADIQCGAVPRCKAALFWRGRVARAELLPCPWPAGTMSTRMSVSHPVTPPSGRSPTLC